MAVPVWNERVLCAQCGRAFTFQQYTFQGRKSPTRPMCSTTCAVAHRQALAAVLAKRL